MNTPITERMGMPLDAFMEAIHQQRFELINGERLAVMPALFKHSKVIRALFRLLDHFVLSHRAGEVYVETTFIRPDAQDRNWVIGSRIPDIMFYAGARSAEYETTTSDERPLALVPDFVIEVVSPTDKVDELDAKIDAYLADGVRLIWVLKPQSRRAVVYRPDAQPQHVDAAATLTADAVLPGFAVSLSALFG